MILVTGGTGLIGSHLLYVLVRKHERVRAIHRIGSDLLSVKKIFELYTEDVDALYQKIEWIEADLNDIPALTEAFQGITKVYHCAANIDFDPSRYFHLKKINVEGTANIVNLSLAHKIEKICYVSSVATFAKALPGKLVKEETYWNPDEKNNVYAISKYGAEMEIWRGTQEGLPAVIVNPGIVLGLSPHSEGSGTIVDLAKEGISYYSEGGMGFVDVRDVVKAMVQLMESAIENEQFILVSANVSYKEVLQLLAEGFGEKGPQKKLNKPIMLFLSNLEWFFSNALGKDRKLPISMVRSMFSFPKYDASKIKSTLDFAFIPFEETIAEVVRGYKKKN